ncbi:MAG: hypothetical protein JWO96_401 [Candidatus Saccharibacteria bacterium]|nr:hypothetical protein [Candidatus Saccharibacteria bacterium]
MLSLSVRLLKQLNCFSCVGRRTGAALSKFLPKAEGEDREPGPLEFIVR